MPDVECNVCNDLGCSLCLDPPDAEEPRAPGECCMCGAPVWLGESDEFGAEFADFCAACCAKETAEDG